MKNRNLILLCSCLSLMIVVGFSVTLNRQAVIAEETVNQVTISGKKIEVDVNPTIKQAIERAKLDPEFWNSEADKADSVMVLAVGGGFLQGEMIDNKEGVIVNSESDPDATTLGEIRKALRENGLSPVE